MAGFVLYTNKLVTGAPTMGAYIAISVKLTLGINNPLSFAGEASISNNADGFGNAPVGLIPMF